MKMLRPLRQMSTRVTTSPPTLSGILLVFQLTAQQLIWLHPRRRKRRRMKFAISRLGAQRGLAINKYEKK